MGLLNFLKHKKEEEIEPYDLAEKMKEIIIDALTGGDFEEELYRKLKEELFKDPLVAENAPEIVKKFDSLMEIFRYVQPMFKENKYKMRKKYIEKEFDPFLKFLKKADIDEVKRKLIIDDKYIEKTWRKAQKKVKRDPDEALEIAYILLEDTARYILDDMDIPYNEEEMTPSMLIEILMDHIKFSSDEVIEVNFKQGFLFISKTVEQMDMVKDKITEPTEEFKLDAEVVVNIIGTSCLYLYKKYQFIKLNRAK